MSVARRVPGVNGVYFDEDVPARPNPEALEVTNQERLMKATARPQCRTRPRSAGLSPRHGVAPLLARAEAGVASRVRWVHGPSAMRPALSLFAWTSHQGRSADGPSENRQLGEAAREERRKHPALTGSRPPTS